MARDHDLKIPNFHGEIHTGKMVRSLYAVDASVYRELPQAVILPRNADDVGAAVKWAGQHRVPLIPRGGGTSLAGQVVGSGVVMDVSKYMNGILEIDPVRRRVRVEPGVVRDQLNAVLKPHGLFFAPITSTASRANIGGMIGNNSCGSNSMVYGSVRDHLAEVRGFLSDGSQVVFQENSPERIHRGEGGSLAFLTLGDTLPARLYDLIHHPANREIIQRGFPPPEVTRRNTGYALDSLLEGKFNLARLIAGSEGTLMMITEAVLELLPLPWQHQAVVAVHCQSVMEALKLNLIALDHHPSSCELIDDIILECTKNNFTQRQNRSFVKGEPRAMLLVEFQAPTSEALEEKVSSFRGGIADLSLAPVLYGEEVSKVWSLRAAGLGVMNTLPGDAKPHAVVEDAAVDPRRLPEFITDYDREMEALGLKSIYYGHAGSGELHLRPIINLKTEAGQRQFRQAGEIMAQLVIKYRGSLSGEHGDGRLRGEFIPRVMGAEVYSLFREVKDLFDPQRIFNPGKIIDTPPMDSGHRYEAGQTTPEIETVMDFSREGGILRAVEMCNGSGDCRKGAVSGGTMCPSYMALGDERETTRGRANTFREVLSRTSPRFFGKGGSSFFDSEEIKSVTEYCLSCKGCKAECPSNIDMAKLKAEFQHHYHRIHGPPPLGSSHLCPSPSLEGIEKSPWGLSVIQFFQQCSPPPRIPV